MFRQVLVPVEFSACGRLAAMQACDVVRAIGGTVTLLHVLENSRPEGRGPEEALTEQAQFGEAQAQLGRLSLYARRPPVCLIVPDPNGVAPAILEVAARIGAELIILGLHRHDGVCERNLGRVVRQVLLGACVPVQMTPSRGSRMSDDGWRGVLNGRLVDLL